MSDTITRKKIRNVSIDKNGLDYTLEDDSGGRTNYRNNSDYIRHLVNLQKVYGGDLYWRSDGTYELENENGRFFRGGRAYNAKTGKMEDYNEHTGRFYSSLAAPAAKAAKAAPAAKAAKAAKAAPAAPAAKAAPAAGTSKTHSATYNPINGAEGAYAVKGWNTTAWGGGKKGVLDSSVAQKLGLKEGSTAEDAQKFLNSKGYNISADNYWGKQSQAAFDDYINRGTIKTTVAEAPKLQEERQNYGTYNPETKTYSYNKNFEITPDQLKAAGVTNFRGYQNFMGNTANATNDYKNVYNFFNRLKSQNTNINFDNETSFNNFFGTSGHFGRRDRNRIIGAGARSQASYDKVSPQGTPIRTDYGKAYDTLYNTLTEDDRKAGTIQWVNSNNSTIPVYQASNGQYYKVGDDGKLSQTGTYTMGSDGKYSVSFRYGGSINKFQQGGAINMDEQQMQQAFLQYLAQQTGAKSQEELEQIIQQMGEDGLKQAYAQFVQAMQQQQVQAAKFGAKLNYIKQLNGQCPQGMEMHYFKQGGRLCKKCMAMEAQGGTVDKPVGDAITQFKAAVGRNKKKFRNKYDKDQLAGRKPVGKDSQGRDLYLDGDGNAKPVSKS